MMAHVALIEPTVALEADYRAFVEEFYSIDGLFARRAGDDFIAFVQQLEAESRGENLSTGKVPHSTFWLVREETQIVGASRLRHCLTPALEEWGGHIGYNVRPSEWRKGYGTLLLALTMQKARERGMSRVLVMCNADNIGSKRIIEKNGGNLASEGIAPDSGKPMLRYWIEL